MLGCRLGRHEDVFLLAVESERGGHADRVSRKCLIGTSDFRRFFVFIRYLRPNINRMQTLLLVGPLTCKQHYGSEKQQESAAITITAAAIRVPSIQQAEDR
jgi:hypothetical protein